MKIKKIMTKNVGVCAPHESVARAVEVMWANDCGAIPVVREEKPIGMVTDRDIAVALTTRNCLASEIQVGQLTGRRIVVCRAKDKVKDALKKMAKFRIRRLPVVDKKGNLVGIVTFADILRVSEGDKKLRRLAVRTLGSILKPQASVGEDKKEK